MGTVAGFEYYNEVLSVSCNYLLDNNYLKKENYKTLCRRHRLTVVKRGCKTSPALISFNSLPERIKKEVINGKELQGRRPEEVVKKEKKKCSLLMMIERKDSDGEYMEMVDWVNNYKSSEEEFLEKEKREIIKNNIKITEGIMSLYKQIDLANKAGGKKMPKKRFWQNMTEYVSGEVMEEYPNSLPQSERKLYQKVKDYQENGKEVFIHKSYGNKNAEKLSDEQRAAVVSWIGKGNKFTDMQVRRIAEQYGIKISERRIRQIRKEENLYITAQREGSRVFYNSKTKQVDRQRPDMPLKFITLDGWDVELYYQNEDSYWNRLTVVVILDAMNDYPLGYAIGKHENANLTVEALKDAVHHTAELLGDYQGFWQIQSDNYARKILPEYYQSICKYYTPSAVGNAKSKPVERYWQYLKNDYFFIFDNYSHSNVTSEDQPNSEFLNTMKVNFPSEEECITVISQVLEIERKKKSKKMKSAWAEGEEKYKLPFNKEKYLMQFGEQGNGNMLTANGIKMVRGGKEYKFECDEIGIREHSDKRWILHYDLADMSQAVAESEDGRYRYMVYAKERVPMALCDYTEEDFAKLDRYRDFNKRLITQVEEKVAIRQKLANDYISKAQLEGDLAARVLMDKNGQHKDNKYLERDRALIGQKSENIEEKERDILNSI